MELILRGWALGVPGAQLVASFRYLLDGDWTGNGQWGRSAYHPFPRHV